LPPFPLRPKSLGALNIPVLAAFVTAAKQDNPVFAEPSAINAIAGPNVNPQLQDSLPHGFRVPQIALLELVYPSDDSRFCPLVPETLHPLLKREMSSPVLIVGDFEHG
jgi:hypothetical protein